MLSIGNVKKNIHLRILCYSPVRKKILAAYAYAKHRFVRIDISILHLDTCR